jgi:serine/threonine protein kinase
MLGQGGMGNVFAARDRLKNENVAIKVLRQDLMFSAAAKERFLAEAKVSCNFSHPNIVNVYDVGVSGGNYYFSMELLKGQTLRARMEKHHRDRRLFTTAEVNEITRQLVDALRYAHRFIVHRDIKPENVWVEHDGTVKLMDFGIAHANANSDMTQTGMTLGTAYYMAPEQRTAAKEVDWRADQYSLGIVLYELFAGSVPMGAARPLEQLRRDIPKRYSRAVMRAIASHPEDRWPSLQAFFSELVRQQHKTPWAAAAVAVGVVAAVAVGAGVYLYQDRNSDQGTAQTSGPSTGPSSSAGPANQGTAKPVPVGTNPAVATGTDATSGANLTQLNNTKPENPSVLVPVVGPATANVSGGSSSPPSVAGGGEVGKKPPDSPSIAPLVNTSPRGPTQEQLAAMANASKQRDECVAQCSRDEGECKRINERARRDCVRSSAFGGNTAGASIASCNSYGPERCYGADRDACIRDMLNRRAECLRSAGGRQGPDCTSGQREADQRCLAVKQECAVSCR